jgi:hypothetical protein
MYRKFGVHGSVLLLLLLATLACFGGRFLPPHGENPTPFVRFTAETAKAPALTPIATTALPTVEATAMLQPTNTPTETPRPPIGPKAAATEVPTPVPMAAPVGMCREPTKDYARVTVNGEVVNRRTALMLDTAAELYSGPGDLRRVTQGSYTDALEASFGSHAGGGVVDISIRNPANPSEYLFGEVGAMVLALRQAGFAAWYRAPGELYEGSAPHIHAVAIGDQELSPAAQEQLTGPHGYFRGMDGLPRNPPYPDRQGGPIICPWMLEAGYADLREENPSEMP